MAKGHKNNFYACRLLGLLHSIGQSECTRTLYNVHCTLYNVLQCTYLSCLCSLLQIKLNLIFLKDATAVGYTVYLAKFNFKKLVFLSSKSLTCPPPPSPYLLPPPVNQTCHKIEPK